MAVVPPPPISAVAVVPPAIAPSAVAAPVAPSLLELMMLNMLQTQAQAARHQAHFSTFNYPHLPTPGVQPPIPIAIPARTASPVPTSPGPKLVHPQVTLDEFCAYYSISLADRECLDKLKYCPGDALEKLDREDWQGEAGFSKLAWCCMLEVHRTFMRDVKRGIWLAQ